MMQFVEKASGFVSMAVLVSMLLPENMFSQATKLLSVTVLSVCKCMLIQVSEGGDVKGAFSLDMDVWTPKLFSLWRIFTLSCMAVSLETLSVVTLSFVPEIFKNQLAKVFLISFCLVMSHLLAMSLDIIPNFETMLAEVLKISAKCNYMEKRLMSLCFYSTHELVRQLCQLIQEYDARKDPTFGYVNRHAQALLSRAKMSWVSCRVSPVHAEMLLKLCILQAKEHSKWIDNDQIGYENCFPGLSQWADVEHRVQVWMNKGWLKTHDELVHNVSQALIRQHSMIQDTANFPLILVPCMD